MNYIPIHLDLELSNICNAACPMCARTNINNTKPNNVVPSIDNKTQISFYDFKTIMDKNPYIKSYNFCGNWGDPIATKDFLKIIEYIAKKDITITIHTNGGLKTKSWWEELGKILSCNIDNTVIFGIDGLEDTHSVYRRHTNFNKIIENAAAYINNTKAISIWSFIPFKHNEHQIESAKDMAKKMNFTKFIINNTARFKNTKEFIFYEDGLKNILEKAEISPEIVYNYSNKIECFAKKYRRIYLSFDKLVFPCCYTEGSFRKKNDEYLNDIIEFNNLNKLNALEYSFVEIIQSDIFKLLELSWSKNNPKTCFRRCSLNHSNIREISYL